MERFNNHWQFKLETDTHWQDVQIPHDWLIKDTKNLYKDGVGLYRKTFTLTQAEAGQVTYLEFDGIYMDASLYINSQHVADWKHGYTNFTANISGFVTAGENLVEVKVVYQSPNSRWYSGAGIYRDCFIIKKAPTHLVPHGLYVSTAQNGQEWDVNIALEVAGADSFKIVQNIKYLHNGQPVDCPQLVNPNITGGDMWLSAATHKTADGTYALAATVENPKLWDINHPHRYVLETQLVVDGKVVDVESTPLGFRTIQFTTDDGFWLNGRRVPLNGVCQHHDLGALGAAVNKDALRRQMEILQQMGVNAIRTAHNPSAKVFMELADEMGILVMTELTDMWRRSKTKYDYARFFDEWVAKDVAAWVRRDRNHPCLIMWSIGNEIYDTHASYEDGAATMKMLMAEVAKHDPEENGFVTFSSNYMPWENTQKCADIIKLVGYNYADNLYADHHEKYPDWIIYGGETSSTVQSRGIYHFPLKKSLLSDDDLQCSSLGNSAVSWGAKSTEACVLNHRDAKFCPGQFLWTGADYIGEPTPYHTKNSYFGQIDTAGFPKDAFYIYKSAWTHYKDDPFVHLFPYWDFSPGQPVDVRIASNAPKVALYVNDALFATQEIDNEKGATIVPSFTVPYAPGSIKAIAYDENGAEIATCERHSFTDAVGLKYHQTQVGDLYFSEIYAIDAQGHVVENANNRVKVTVENGALLGLDNGDSTDYDQYQDNNNRRLFSGRLLAISTSPQVAVDFVWEDTPIRKIELLQNGYEITAKTYPANATYTDLTWRLTNDGGIDSPLGKLEINGNTATLKPKGDGEVYVRCSTQNGANHPALISLMPIEISGYGTPFLDPYSFISGGLYNCSNQPMDNGNDRGIATARAGESHVGFANLDFGKYGADEFTIGLFPLTGEPFPIEIWLGLPGSHGARKLDTVMYDKGSIWNTYIDVTYKLPERLTGVQTLCFVVGLKVHIKGFKFKGRALEQLPFAASDSIYGDTFTTRNGRVEGIGNNVSIVFDNMVFDQAVTALEIAWRSSQDKNDIKIVFEGDEEIANMVTLPAQAEYGSCTIALENAIVGQGRVSFIFLPGSDIDLEWFRFVN